METWSGLIDYASGERASVECANGSDGEFLRSQSPQRVFRR